MHFFHYLMNIFNWMLVQWTSKLCPFHISKNIFWVQVHYKSQFWLIERVFFSKILQAQLVTFDYLLNKFEEELYKFLSIIKERNRQSFFIHIVFVSDVEMVWYILDWTLGSWIEGLWVRFPSMPGTFVLQQGIYPHCCSPPRCINGDLVGCTCKRHLWCELAPWCLCEMATG